MHVTDSLENARHDLERVIQQRLWDHPLPDPVERLRYPVGLFFLRGDRAGLGRELAEQATASFDYWNRDSAQYLDVIFPGWGKGGEAMIWVGLDGFLQFKQEVEAASRWQYGGEAEILFLNFDFYISHWSGPRSFLGKGSFAFDEVMVLPVESMVKNGRVLSLDSLMQQLINSAKTFPHRSAQSSLWAIRDRVAVEKTREAAWEGLKRLFLKDLADVEGVLRPFKLHDLRK